MHKGYVIHILEMTGPTENTSLRLNPGLFALRYCWQEVTLKLSLPPTLDTLQPQNIQQNVLPSLTSEAVPCLLL